jgi:hypothetical protein
VIALRGKFLPIAILAFVLGVAPAVAQVPSFDGRPTGFLSVSAGGMPPDSWAGTSLGAAKRLVSALPAAPRSRALRDVQFKVLVSQLTPPAADGSPAPSLFARKVDRLAAMGEAENLNEMVRSVGGYADPAVAAVVVNSLMLAGEKEGACAIVRKHPLPEPFKARADAACLLVSGDNGAAIAAAAALRGGDPALAKLVEIAAQGLPPSAPPPTLLDGPAMVMLDLAYVPPSAAALRTTDPPLMRALVAHRTLPAATRIDISERGEALAIIEATKLGDLYIQALRDGVVLPAPMARRARLVTAARRAANAQEVVDSLIAVYGESRGGSLFPTVARASAIGLLNLPADEQFANVAQEAMRGFLLLGDKRRTKAWTELAVKAALGNARATNALDRLLPLVAIAGVDDAMRLPAEDINRWYQVMRQDDPAGAPLRGYLLLELFRATGIDVPQGSTQLPEARPAGARLVSPSPATMQALQSAASARRRAETALLASIAVGETPLTGLNPAAVGAIVRALRQVGEDHAARLYAVETAIAHGL